MSQLHYTPPASAAGFLTCDKFISLICGPIGSTKTTAGIMKIAYHASQMAPCRDGVRRSKAVWVRNTREQLRDTSIPDVMRWYPPGIAGDFMKTENKFTLRFNDVECEILFRGLDDADDVRRLLSLQASFGILDEFREIHKDIFEALQGRLGRYPSKLDNGVGCVTDRGVQNAHLWGMTNPPDMDTFWEQFLTNPPSNAGVYFQPSGLSQEADWVQWLPDGYYENLANGKSQDWIDVYINAQFGKTLAGRAVWQSFKPDFHVAKNTLRPLKTPDKPLIIGMDFGLNPSCTINQMDFQGRLLTYEALTAHEGGMGVTRFIQQMLKPKLAERFGGCSIVVIGDPAGTQRAQTDERSVFDILRAAGFKVLPARTNAIVARIAAVDHFLTRQIDGGPAHLIDPVAKPIINAMRGGYRYKAKKNGEYDESPEKNVHSHIADAHQYACLHAGVGAGFGQSMQQKARPVVKASSLGWT